MKFEKADLDRIFQRSSGICHICHKPLCRKNYSMFGKRGAWEVEHSVAQSNGGTHHGNNLYAAHISCNRKKGKMTTRTARKWHGKTKAPMSVARRAKAKSENTVLWGALGTLAGMPLGPVGMAAGGALGATFGNSLNPDETG